MFSGFFGNPEKNLDAQDRIEAALDTELRARHLRAVDLAFDQEFSAVQDWQARRLLIQYDHLFVDKSTAKAAEFILKEVYSGDQLASISNEIRKTARKAWRLAPADMVDTAADAIEAHVDTQNLDEGIALHTLALGGLNSSTGSHLFRSALLSGEILAERQEQLIKLRRLARSIESYLNKGIVHIGLKMTTRLARKAGVFNLHQFLSKACFVLKDASGISHILDEITATELELLDQVARGNNPFEFMDVALNVQYNSRLVPSI